MVKPVDKRWCLPHKIHINSLLEFKSHILSRNSDLIASNIAGRAGLVRPVIKIMPSHHLLGPLSFSQHLVYFSSQYILDFLPTSEGLLGCLSISLSSCQILLSSYLFPRKFWTPPTTFENLLLSSLSIFQDLLRSDWCDGFVALVYCQRRLLQDLRLTCNIRCSCMSTPVRFCETGWAGKFLLTCCQTSPLS